ncbi:MAG: 30S ribosomal protein S3 [Parcubacteria group bacterium CG1_02_36_42]|uniref:Small ribosomal subunit protein uS3 n=1 Tax=Candidatus Nealsonbacteria bacterium CG_4_9_14_0_8_um_filter_35_12 TaxID=1974692 RepID=A0A2M8DMI3_9BACT|nr:MAG: 30S ribosomal protein S3 [Parcubacteria group bacterium CG1_02_36_42]PJB99330.1 MAG: 30S ribosomal protein S3 [Candidatus Nealsonbacteria bacterium CG_4_9_14_0_8_um_filter_35_12]
MSHQVHPKIFRIKEITDWNSRGFYEKGFSNFLKEDFEIRGFLTKKLPRGVIEKIEIERFPSKISVILFTARPGLVIGRRGEGIEALKSQLERKILKKDKKSPIKELKIEIIDVKDPWASASLAAQWMAQQIEARVPYRRVLKQALSKITTRKEVQGARVQVAGRLDGVEIARTEWLKAGKLPRQTLRADIDYAQARAYCRYGVVGIKVWIYKGEKL